MKRREKGFSLLELAVVAVVLSSLLAVFLDRLTFYQEAAERARFEATLSIFKTALQIRLANLILERREGEAKLLEDENPTLWLSEKPSNYAGDYPQRPEVGNWYFDAATRELVYVVNLGRGLATESRNDMKQLRFKVLVTYQAVHAGARQIQGIGGVFLRPSGAYRWS